MRSERSRRKRKSERITIQILALIFLSLVLLIGYLVTVHFNDEVATTVESQEIQEEPSEEHIEIEDPVEEAELDEEAEPVEEEEPAPPIEEEVEIEIVFAGDTMFDWELKPLLEREGYDYPFTYIKEAVQAADYAFINAETVFTENPTIQDPDQIFWINSDLRALHALQDAGFKMINIGNNHTLDYREQGLVDTINYLEEMDMDWIGAGKNREQAYQSKVVDIKGKKFRFFTFVRFIPNTNWLATDDKPGVPNGYDLELIKQTISEQSGDEDYTIVYFHWGVEKTNTPVEYQLEYVDALKALGVDLIVGSHPHVLQGFGYYDDMAVAYSLGNFLFPPYVSGRTAETGLLKATFKGDEVSMAFEPYIIDNGQIIPVDETVKQEMLQYLQSISFDVQIDGDGNIHHPYAIVEKNDHVETQKEAFQYE